jgi:hypothetical protein
MVERSRLIGHSQLRLRQYVGVSQVLKSKMGYINDCNILIHSAATTFTMSPFVCLIFSFSISLWVFTITTSIRGGVALSIFAVSSFIGSLLAIIGIILFAPALAQWSLAFGQSE